MKNKLLALLAVAALAACGGTEAPDLSAASTDAIVVTHREGLPRLIRDMTSEELAAHPEAQPSDGIQQGSEDPGEIGQLRSGVTGTQVWGQHGTPLGPFHEDYCTFPNSSGDMCGIPLDKIIHYDWNGPTTSPMLGLEGIDFRALMRDALSSINALGIGWTVVEGNDHSGEHMVLGNDSTPNMCDSSGCSIGFTQTFYSGSGQCSGGKCYRWQNGCQTFINTSELSRESPGLSVAEKKFRITRLMRHEIGHCMGFSDFELAINFTGDQLMWWSSPPWTPSNFGANEQTSLFFFNPGH